MSVTARFADLVLPAAIYLETEDLYRAYGTYYMQYAPRAVAPRGLAWSNFQLAQALAGRMGLTDPVFQMPEQGAMRELFRAGNCRTRDTALDRDARRAAAFDPDAVRTAGPIRIAPADAQRFTTPSGKLEFYSQSLADRGSAAMPDWRPDPEEQALAARWPLRLLTAPGYFQPHTTYSGVHSLRQQERAPVCILHPDEAKSRQLRDGQYVCLFNDLGTVGLVLKISDEVQMGVAFVPGQRRDDETLSGTVNMLCSDRYTDMGDGATYQSTWLEVTAWDAVLSS